MGCYLLSDDNWPEHPKCDVLPLAEKFAVVLAIMLFNAVSYAAKVQKQPVNSH